MTHTILIFVCVIFLTRKWPKLYKLDEKWSHYFSKFNYKYKEKKKTEKGRLFGCWRWFNDMCVAGREVVAEHRKLKEKKHSNPVTLVPTSLIHICRWRLNFKQLRKENSAAGTYMNARLIMAAERKRHKGHSKVWSSVSMYLETVCSRACVVPTKVLVRPILLVSEHCYVYSDTVS
jgi:hypothetical protein